MFLFNHFTAYHVCHKIIGNISHMYAHYLAEGCAVFSPFEKRN